MFVFAEIKFDRITNSLEPGRLCLWEDRYRPNIRNSTCVITPAEVEANANKILDYVTERCGNERDWRLILARRQKQRIE